MKTKKITLRLTGAVACVTAFLIGATPMTAFAHTGPEAECICEDKCSEDCINEECPVCKEDYTLCQGEEVVEDTEEKTEEPMGPLTPDGNMTLVDDYGSMEAGGKQFITVVTKSGNYFYIIIDRDDNGTETVHFLNMVDEADLMALMDEDEQKAFQESLDTASKEDTTKETVENPTDTEEETEPTVEKQKPSVSPAAIVALIIFLGAGGFMGFKYLKEKSPKKESTRPDPDEDYSEDDEEDYLEDADEDVEVEEPEDDSDTGDEDTE